jgi:membrane protease YdiL (CAAX protease family)
MISSKWRWGKVLTFVLLTFAISSIFYWIMYSTGSARDIGVLWMWSPAAGAILTQILFRGNLRDVGSGPGPKKYLLWGLMIPLVYALIIYGIAWATGLAGFRKPTPGYILFIPIGFVAACLAALGEEIGWRGLLVPELSRLTTFTSTALLTWIIWAVWHYPAILFADYHSQAPRLFDLSTLTITVLGFSFFTVWLRLKSGSIWPVVLWHGMHNLLIQEVFIHMSTATPVSKFIIDDFGIGVMLAASILGVVFWKKRFELMEPIRPTAQPDRPETALSKADAP